MVNPISNKIWIAAVVAQLVERSLQTPEIPGLNPVMDKIFILSIGLKRRK